MPTVFPSSDPSDFTNNFGNLTRKTQNGDFKFPVRLTDLYKSDFIDSLTWQDLLSNNPTNGQSKSLPVVGTQQPALGAWYPFGFNPATDIDVNKLKQIIIEPEAVF